MLTNCLLPDTAVLISDVHTDTLHIIIPENKFFISD
jgi:hypothetical protein